MTRNKGRDFYDARFLLGQGVPDYEYLAAKKGIRNKEELKVALTQIVNTTDLKMRYKDFEHLLFNKENAEKVLRFGDFVKDF